MQSYARRRLVPQIAYAMSAYLTVVKQGVIKLGDAIDIAYPTGNFGNILGAICAQRMGLPLRKIVCAANDNSLLCRIYVMIFMLRRSLRFDLTLCVCTTI